MFPGLLWSGDGGGGGGPEAVWAHLRLEAERPLSLCLSWTEPEPELCASSGAPH